MFIVVEYNQASYRPRILTDDPIDDRAEAEEIAQQYRDDLIARGSGRRETYAVWTCDEIDEIDEVTD